MQGSGSNRPNLAGSRRTFLKAGAAALALIPWHAPAVAQVADSDRGVQLPGIDELSDPKFAAVESGYRRLPSGHLLISAHHRMLGCRGKMIQWWLARDLSEQEFRRWHPLAHISIQTIREGDTRGVGKQIRVNQTVGEQSRETILESRDPSEYFDDLDALRATGVTAVICNRGRLANLSQWTTRIIHVCRDFDWGCEMRSRFWLGPFAPVNEVPPKSVLESQLPEMAAAGLLKHTVEEYTYLAQFLPDYYEAHAR